MARNSQTHGRRPGGAPSARAAADPGVGGFGLPFPNPLLESALQMQRIGQQVLQDVRGDAETGSDEVRQAKTPLDVQSLQAEFLATEWARMVQWSERLLAVLLDAQSAWVKGIESWTADWMRACQANLQPAPPAGPAAWLAAAQTPWTEMMSAWQGAIVHDLQADTPVRPD